ncbi:MAG: hypothetical protein LBG48_04280, partial [Rickettsiales bacterium]|nr:hypothetical protein [Rickettsiales bacterium]
MLTRGLPTNCCFNAPLLWSMSCGLFSSYQVSYLISPVIAELEFLNERSEFRNSLSAIQVTMKTKTLELFFVNIFFLQIYYICS